MFSRNKKQSRSAATSKENGAANSLSGITCLPKIPKGTRIPYFSGTSGKSKRKGSTSNSSCDGTATAMARSFSFSNYKASTLSEAMEGTETVPPYAHDSIHISYAQKKEDVGKSPFFGSLPRLKHQHEVIFEPYVNVNNNFRSETPISSSSICSEIAAFFGVKNKQNNELNTTENRHTAVHTDYSHADGAENSHAPNLLYCSSSSGEAPKPAHRSSSEGVAAGPNQRTAVVGPRTVARGYDEEVAAYSGDVVNRMSRSLYENGCENVISHSTPKRRDHSSGPHRHSVQELDGSGLYQLCNSSRNRPSFPDIEMYSGLRPNRPSDLHLSPSSVGLTVENSIVAVKSPVTPSTRLPAANEMNYQMTAGSDKRATVSNSASKKVMVAPQPHYHPHNSDVCDDLFRNNGDMQVINRRRSSGGVGSAYPTHENRHSYSRDVSVAVVPGILDDDPNLRIRSSGDVRVTALEKRVRELEAVICNGSTQLSNSASSGSSFIVPVQRKSPQVILSPVSSTTTQQLMAQEIAAKEVEIVRLQSQLRHCYSRMESRKVQFEEEVEKFRTESYDAKMHLEKVKQRLKELENECSEYREKATLVEAARNSAIATSLEKISAQQKELSSLRTEVSKLGLLSAELEKVKGDLNKSTSLNADLRNALEAKEKNIQELEDSLFAFKMEASCRISSGSATPCEEARSLIDVELPKYLGGAKELMDLTPKFYGKRASSSCTPSFRLKKSQSSQHLHSSDEKLTLSSSLSALIRKQAASTLECRLLAKCLKDTASKAVNGDLPSVTRLLGCRSESMSESEAESLPTDSSPMSLSSAERHITKTTDDLQRVENDLNSLREKFVEYYEKKVVEDLQANDMCRIQ